MDKFLNITLALLRMFPVGRTSILLRDLLMTLHIWDLQDIPLDHLLKPHILDLSLLLPPTWCQHLKDILLSQDLWPGSQHVSYVLMVRTATRNLIIQGSDCKPINIPG